VLPPEGDEEPTADDDDLPDDEEGAESVYALERVDPLTRYMNMVRRYPVLDADAQQALAWRYYNDADQRAAQELVRSNLRLVVKIALQYWRRWADIMELVAQGNLGLVEAIHRFDPARGIRFPSYAQYWIRAFILSYMMDHFRMMKLSSTRAGRRLFWRLNKERRALLAEGYTPTTKLLAERVGVTEQDVDAVARVLDAPAQSMHAPIAPGESRTVEDALEDPAAASPERASVEGQLKERLDAALAKFGQKLRDDKVGERDLVIWTQRLATEEPKTLNEVGEVLGVSRERVRQLEVRLKKRAREFLETELGEDVLLDMVADD
jgi:RNA polymerase sigma-32 factor